MESHRKVEKVVTENDYICHLCGLLYKDTNNFNSHTVICEKAMAPTGLEESPHTEDSHKPPQTLRTPSCLPMSTPRDISHTESNYDLIKRVVNNTLLGDTPTCNEDIGDYWEVKNMEVRENEGSTASRQWETHQDIQTSGNRDEQQDVVDTDEEQPLVIDLEDDTDLFQKIARSPNYGRRLLPT